MPKNSNSPYRKAKFTAPFWKGKPVRGYVAYNGTPIFMFRQARAIVRKLGGEYDPAFDMMAAPQVVVGSRSGWDTTIRHKDKVYCGAQGERVTLPTGSFIVYRLGNAWYEVK